MTDAVIEWLLESDPAIRWQTMRDLANGSPRAVERERAKVAREGWGARLLDKQQADGRWVGGRSSDAGMYAPKWTSTHYTMLLLRELGLPANNAKARKTCGVLLDRGLQSDGGVAYDAWAQWTKKGETCVTSMALSILSYFEYDDDRVDGIAGHLLSEQMPDGGWNCRQVSGATHSSMNTTILALEGLLFYERFRDRNTRAVRAAQNRGREFLLEHKLFRSHRTGKVIKPDFVRFVFPPQWHFDVLRALDHFRDAGARRDERLSDALDLVHTRRRPDGRWPLDYRYRGKAHFHMEKVGAPSRWNTLRALRVLKWWEQ